MPLRNLAVLMMNRYDPDTDVTLFDLLGTRLTYVVEVYRGRGWRGEGGGKEVGVWLEVCGRRCVCMCVCVCVCVCVCGRWVGGVHVHA